MAYCDIKTRQLIKDFAINVASQINNISNFRIDATNINISNDINKFIDEKILPDILDGYEHTINSFSEVIYEHLERNKKKGFRSIDKNKRISLIKKQLVFLVRSDVKKNLSIKLIDILNSLIGSDHSSLNITNDNIDEALENMSIPTIIDALSNVLSTINIQPKKIYDINIKYIGRILNQKLSYYQYEEIISKWISEIIDVKLEQNLFDKENGMFYDMMLAPMFPLSSLNHNFKGFANILKESLRKKVKNSKRLKDNIKIIDILISLSSKYDWIIINNSLELEDSLHDRIAYYKKGKVYFNIDKLLSNINSLDFDKILLEEIIHIFTIYIEKYDEELFNNILSIAEANIGFIHNDKISAHEIASKYIIDKIVTGDLSDSNLEVFNKLVSFLFNSVNISDNKTFNDFIDSIIKGKKINKKEFLSFLLEFIEKNNIPSTLDSSEDILFFNANAAFEHAGSINIFELLSVLYNKLPDASISYDSLKDFFDKIKSIDARGVDSSMLIFFSTQNNSFNMSSTSFIYAIYQLTKRISSYYEHMLLIDILRFVYSDVEITSRLELMFKNKTDIEITKQSIYNIIAKNENFIEIMNFYQSYIPSLKEKELKFINDVIDFIFDFYDKGSYLKYKLTFRDFVKRFESFSNNRNERLYEFSKVFVVYGLFNSLRSSENKIIDLISDSFNSYISYIKKLDDSIINERDKEIITKTINNINRDFNALILGLEKINDRYIANQIIETYNKTYEKISIDLNKANIENPILSSDMMDKFFEESEKGRDITRNIIDIIEKNFFNYGWYNSKRKDNTKNLIEQDRESAISIVLYLIDELQYRIRNNISLTHGQMILLSYIIDKYGLYNNIKNIDKESFNKLVYDISSNYELLRYIVVLHFIDVSGHRLRSDEKTLKRIELFHGSFINTHKHIILKYETIKKHFKHIIDIQNEKDLIRIIDEYKQNLKNSEKSLYETNISDFFISTLNATVIMKNPLVTPISESLFHTLSVIPYSELGYSKDSILALSDIHPILNEVLSKLSLFTEDRLKINKILKEFDIYIEENLYRFNILIAKPLEDFIDIVDVGDESEGTMYEFIEELYDLIDKLNRETKRRTIENIVKNDIYKLFSKYDIRIKEGRALRNISIRNISNDQFYILLTKSKYDFPFRLVNRAVMINDDTLGRNFIEVIKYKTKESIYKSSFKSFQEKYLIRLFEQHRSDISNNINKAFHDYNVNNSWIDKNRKIMNRSEIAELFVRTIKGKKIPTILGKIFMDAFNYANNGEVINETNLYDIIMNFDENVFTPLFVSTLINSYFEVSGFRNNEFNEKVNNERSGLFKDMFSISSDDSNIVTAFKISSNNIVKLSNDIDRVMYNKSINNLYNSISLYYIELNSKEMFEYLPAEIINDPTLSEMKVGRELAVSREIAMQLYDSNRFDHRLYIESLTFMQKDQSLYKYTTDQDKVTSLIEKNFSSSGYYNSLLEIANSYDNNNSDMLRISFEKAYENFIKSLKELSKSTTKSFYSIYPHDNIDDVERDYLQYKNVKIIIEQFSDRIQTISSQLFEEYETLMNDLIKIESNLTNYLSKDDDLQQIIDIIRLIQQKTYIKDNKIFFNNIFEVIHLFKLLSAASEVKLNRKHIDNNLMNDYKSLATKSNFFISKLIEISANDSFNFDISDVLSTRIYSARNTNSLTLTEDGNLSIRDYTESISSFGIKNSNDLLLFFISTDYGIPYIGSDLFYRMFSTLKGITSIITMSKYMFSFTDDALNYIYEYLTLSEKKEQYKNNKITISDVLKYQTDNLKEESFIKRIALHRLFILINASHIDSYVIEQMILKLDEEQKDGKKLSIKDIYFNIIKERLKYYSRGDRYIGPINNELINMYLTWLDENIDFSGLNKYISELKNNHINLSNNEFIKKNVGISISFKDQAKLSNINRVYNTNTNFRYDSVNLDVTNGMAPINPLPLSNTVNRLLFDTLSKGMNYTRSLMKTSVPVFNKFQTIKYVNEDGIIINDIEIEKKYVNSTLSFIKSLQDDNPLSRYIAAKLHIDIENLDKERKDSGILHDIIFNLYDMIDGFVFNNFHAINKTVVSKYVREISSNFDKYVKKPSALNYMRYALYITSSAKNEHYLSIIQQLKGKKNLRLNSDSMLFFAIGMLYDIAPGMSVDDIRKVFINNLNSLAQKFTVLKKGHIFQNNFLSVALNGRNTIYDLIEDLKNDDSGKLTMSLYELYASTVSKQYIINMPISDLMSYYKSVRITSSQNQNITSPRWKLIQLIKLLESLYENVIGSEDSDALIKFTTGSGQQKIESINLARFEIIKKVFSSFNYDIEPVLLIKDSLLDDLLGNTLSSRLKSLFGFVGFIGDHIHYSLYDKTLSVQDQSLALLQILMNSYYKRFNVKINPDTLIFGGINNQGRISYIIDSFKTRSLLINNEKDKNKKYIDFLRESFEKMNEGDPFNDDYYPTSSLVLYKNIFLGLSRYYRINDVSPIILKSLVTEIEQKSRSSSFGIHSVLLKLLYGNDAAGILTSKNVAMILSGVGVISFVLLIFIYSPLYSFSTTVLGNFIGNLLVLISISIVMMIADTIMSMKSLNGIKFLSFIKKILNIASMFVNFSLSAVIITLINLVHTLMTMTVYLFIAFSNNAYFKRMAHKILKSDTIDKKIEFYNSFIVEAFNLYFDKLMNFADRITFSVVSGGNAKQILSFINKVFFEEVLEREGVSYNFLISSKNIAERSVSVKALYLSLVNSHLKELNNYMFFDIFSINNDGSLSFSSEFLMNIKSIKAKYNSNQGLTEKENILVDMYLRFTSDIDTYFNQSVDVSPEINISKMEPVFSEISSNATRLALVNLSPVGDPIIYNNAFVKFLSSFRIFLVILLQPIFFAMFDILKTSKYAGKLVINKYQIMKNKYDKDKMRMQYQINKILLNNSALSSLKNVLAFGSISLSIFSLKSLYNIIVKETYDILLESERDISDIIVSIELLIKEFNNAKAECEDYKKGHEVDNEENPCDPARFYEIYEALYDEYYKLLSYITISNSYISELYKIIYGEDVFNELEYVFEKQESKSLYSEKEVSYKSIEEVLKEIKKLDKVFKRLDRIKNIVNFNIWCKLNFTSDESKKILDDMNKTFVGFMLYDEMPYDSDKADKKKKTYVLERVKSEMVSYGYTEAEAFNNVMYNDFQEVQSFLHELQKVGSTHDYIRVYLISSIISGRDNIELLPNFVEKSIYERANDFYKLMKERNENLLPHLSDIPESNVTGTSIVTNILLPSPIKRPIDMLYNFASSVGLEYRPLSNDPQNSPFKENTNSQASDLVNILIWNTKYTLDPIEINSYIKYLRTIETAQPLLYNTFSNVKRKIKYIDEEYKSKK
ncbi:MAG: hypothetical protein KatS3mg002_1340 [Candidatus Woesearchaeota archaeon]|nr:MAG: hypothetical protein KatS3mg002_1340 [Candidatus Woesearchaeota archaeon]